MPDLAEDVLPPREGEAPKPAGEPPKKRGRPPGTKNKPKLPENLEGDLRDKLTEFVALPISFVSPIAAKVFEQRQDRTIRAIVVIASKNPQFAKALATFLEGSAYFDLVGTVVGMGIGFAVDHGQVEANSMPAMVFHIDEIVMELYPQDAATETANGNGNLVHDRGLLGEIG